MRLLIVTQKVDKDDPILGFFHYWVEEFAKQIANLSVICLMLGRYNLPTRVKIYSLGKEFGESRFKYVVRFFKNLWLLRNDYDTVFVHMNQEYVLLAGWWWRLTGKKILFWRNHPKGNLLTRIALLFADRVFCTSRQSFTAQFKKTSLMPAGVDTSMFRPMPEVKKIPRSILFLSRFSMIKRPHLLVESLARLSQEGVSFSANFIGDVGEKEEDKIYFDNLKNLVLEKGLGDKINFLSGVSYQEVPAIFNAHEVFVNLTPTGSFDKTILEAVGCGVKVLTTNKSFEGLRLISGTDLNFVIVEEDVAEIKDAIKKMLDENISNQNSTTKALIEYLNNNHSLSLVVQKVLANQKVS